MQDVPLSTRITRPVDLRLRMLALLEDSHLNHLVDGLLDKVLPSADELASRVRDSKRHAPETAAPTETERGAVVSHTTTPLSSPTLSTERSMQCSR